MSRSVPEWSSDNHDARIPPRVRLRVFEAAEGRCQVCGRKIGPGDKWQVDHVLALANGGAHAERNFQCICDWCHKAKTREDVAAKSKTAAVRMRHLGIHKPKHPLKSRNTFRPYQPNVRELYGDLEETDQ